MPRISNRAEWRIYMAKMIPDLFPENIENDAERYFYEKAKQLPDKYTVFYSYKFSLDEDRDDPYGLREADFVIVLPQFGFVVVEVKQGHIQYYNGAWQEHKNGRYQELSKNPLEQARTAMFSILNRYRKANQQQEYPLRCRYALCFPESTQKVGMYPEDLNENSCWISSDVDNLEKSIEKLLPKIDQHTQADATKILITRVLAPTFKVFSSMDDQLETFNQHSQIILTEEQERIIEETEEDHRKIFFGAAGTGKTFIAMKKAQDLADQGKRVFLTCFNKHLVQLFNKHCVNHLIKRLNFHDFSIHVLKENGYIVEEPMDPQERSTFYEETVPFMVSELFSLIPEEGKFDAIIVDEGQDFKGEWFLCLEDMMKKEGHFYIFADRHQNLFGHGLDTLKDFQMSKHKLTTNLRNSEKINAWISSLIPDSKLRYRLYGGPEVEYFPWKEQEDELRLIEKELTKLISQGLSPHRITILSPNRKQNSSLQQVDKIGSWNIVDMRDSQDYGISFSTIRAFKGLESDVVFLIGLRQDSRVCSPADIYVGGTRAKFMLKIFHHEDWSYKK
jgi:hypothetical protein